MQQQPQAKRAPRRFRSGRNVLFFPKSYSVIKNENIGAYFSDVSNERNVYLHFFSPNFSKSKIYEAQLFQSP